MPTDTPTPDTTPDIATDTAPDSPAAPTPQDSCAPSPETTPETTPAGSAEAGSVAVGSGSVIAVPAKAAPGQLRDAVLTYLIGLDGGETTVTQVANRLGKSGGAVGNALNSLTLAGLAVLTGQAPKRYRAADGATVPPPRPATSMPTSSAAPPRPRVRKKTTAPAPPAPATPVAPTASPAGVPSAAEPVTGPIARPNGQLYHPRTLAGLADVTALRKLREQSVPVLLYGPPGTGKTSLLEAAFPDLITVAGDGDTTVGDLIGTYTQNPDGTYAWIDGPLVRAMRDGRALLLDDATLIQPKVLAAMYPAMDGRRAIVVKEHLGETITAAAGFYVIAAHNPGVHGAVLTEALASRFSVHVQVSSDYDLARALHIHPMAVRIARNLATQVHKGEIGWAPQLRELLAFQKIADTLGADVAFANLAGIAPPEDRDTVIEVITKATGTKVTLLSLGHQI